LLLKSDIIETEERQLSGGTIMSENYVIGIDIGTTNVKSVLFRTDGSPVLTAEQEIQTMYQENRIVEQDPQEIEQAAQSTLKSIMKKSENKPILGIGLSTAMHSLIIADQQGKAVSNAMIWSDARATKTIDQLDSSLKYHIYQKTGTPVHAMTPFAKLLWMKETRQSPSEEQMLFSIKEYILYHWFGERVIDYAMAAATGLLNIDTLEWDEELLEMTDVKIAQLSKIVAPSYQMKQLKENVQDQLGLNSDIPFIIGSADGQLANLGSGAVEPGEVAISMGTSGAIRQFAKGFPINQTQETFTYAFTKEESIIGGPTNNGGIAIQWLKDILQNEQDFTSFINEAKKSSIGANGLLFIPYINGERAPIWQSDASGEFIGLKMKHQTCDVIRAVLEGITYNLLMIAKSLEGTGYPFKKVNVNGGLTQTSLWNQMLADMLGHPVYVSETHHNAAWGAAFVALYGIGQVEHFSEIKVTLPKEIVYQPRKKEHEAYQVIFKEFSNKVKSL